MAAPCDRTEPALTGGQLRTTVRPLFSAELERGPGCSSACSRLFGHDPLTHERYGRATALRAAPRAPRGPIVVGRLVVHRATLAATVDGRRVSLEPLGHALLCCLADAPGQVVDHDALVMAGWDRATAAAVRQSTDDRRLHFVRAVVMRLRQRLGPDGACIETVKFRGYRLNPAPLIEEEDR